MNHQPRPTADVVLIVKKTSAGDGAALNFSITTRDPAFDPGYKEFHQPLNDKPKPVVKQILEEYSRAAQLADSGEQNSTNLENLVSRKGLYLFEKLFPEAVRELLWRLAGKAETLQIYSKETWIPWELCRLQGGADDHFRGGPFLCEAFAMTRWITGGQACDSFPMRRMAIIQSQEGFLPAGKKEVRSLLKLRSDFRQVSEIPAELARVSQAMSEGFYDAWHFVGHGVVHQGVFCGLKMKNGALFTPDQLTGTDRKMGLTQPLVFLNCCFSNQAGHGLMGIESWAQTLIERKVGAFIGTQWAVKDQAAYDFSRTFYEKFLAGETLAESVRLARFAIRRNGDPSWLAFVVYGDPYARVQDGKSVEREDRVRPFQGERSRRDSDPGPLPAHTDLETRERLLGRIDRFVENKTSTYFLLSGEEGTGKTCLLRQWVMRWPCFHYFFSVLDARVREEGCLAFLAAEVDDRLRSRGQAPTAGVCRGFRDLFERAAGLISDQKPCVFLLDAVDEMAPSAVGTGGLFGLPAQLPAGVKVILSARFFDGYPGDAAENLDLDSKDSAGDGFLLKRLSEAGLSEEKRMLLSQPAQSNPLWFYYLFEELRHDLWALKEKLPFGLEAYYRARWQRWLNRGAEFPLEQGCAILATLCAIREAVPLDVLTRFCRIEAAVVAAVLDHWHPLISCRPGGVAGHYYRLHHRGFRTFLLGEGRIGAGDVEIAHERIVETLRDFAAERSAP